MNANDLQRYKRLLLAKRDELATKRDTAAPAPVATMQGDSGDQASADAEADLNILLRQSDTRLLRTIDAALRRIMEDRFGVCEECGSPISKARLEALPWTPLCRDCMDEQQSAA